MPKRIEQENLFPEGRDASDDVVIINGRCRLHRRGGYCVVSVSGVPVSHYGAGDRMGEALAMVNLVNQGLARQTQVAAAFGCDVRTVRRQQRRYDDGGLASLGRPRGYPRGRPRLPRQRTELVDAWRAEGVSHREIARRLGVSDKAVRKLLRRLGWRQQKPEQLEMPGSSADPKLSALEVAEPQSTENTEETTHLNADPKLSALAFDPADRSLDRLLACLGLLDDAAPLFGPATALPGAGVLLAIPAILDSGVIDIARNLYGDIAPAFYGLRTTVLTLILMALLRIKRPETLKEHSPRELGRLLGLDRAPEVKTLRRKLRRLAAHGHAKDFGRALAQRRVATRGHAMGFLYVDGHVRAYHGKRTIPKTHIARMRISMPATTDYWVNDAAGDPLLLVTAEAHKGMVKMLPDILEDVRDLVGQRRVTIVFDRGGWSPMLFKKLITDGFDIMTYRKGKSRPVTRKYFGEHRAVIEGVEVAYWLADRGIRLKNGLRLRQVTRLSDNGHQTPIVTSRRDLPAIEVAYRTFSRWRQENFFKYLRQEYALDALVDYDTEPADALRDVPNPARKAINAKIHAAYAEFAKLAAALGLQAATNRESLRRTMRGFKIANAPLAKRLRDAVEKINARENQRRSVPARVPVSTVIDGDVVKLSVERKHLSDLFKMVAYQAESDLLRLLAPHYARTEDEGRTVIQNALMLPGDIEVGNHELKISLDAMSSPHRTKALAAMCRTLNEQAARFPGTKLRLRFAVKPAPEVSMAFPGLKPTPPSRPKPDIFERG